MNTTYLNGIYQAKSESLINVDNIKELNKIDLINYLKNNGYGQGTNYSSLDNIINNELKNVREELNRLSESTLMGDIFFIDEDLTNIKIVYKSSMFNIAPENHSLISRFDVNYLGEFFKNNNDSFISIYDKELFIKLKEVNEESPKESLELIEKIYYDHIYQLAKDKLPFLIEYIETKNFNKNFLNFLKLKNRNDSVDNLKKLLLPQNNFDKDYWLELFELNSDQVVERLSSVYFGLITESLNTFFTTNNIQQLKKDLNERLTDNVLSISYNLNVPSGVLNYLHLKNNEVNNLRWIYYANK